MADPTPAVTTESVVTSDSTASSTTIKPGVRTSEFWLSLLAVLLGACLDQGLIGAGTEAAKIAGVALIALATLGYTYGRTKVKS